MTRIGCAETQARGILAGKFSQTRRVRRRFLSRRSILRWGMISVLPTRITRPKRPHAAIAETLSTGNAAGASYITTTTRGQRSFWASTRRLMEAITSRSRHIRCMITGMSQSISAATKQILMKHTSLIRKAFAINANMKPPLECGAMETTTTARSMRLIMR